MQHISRLFRKLSPLDPPAGLLGVVLARVHTAAAAYARRLFWQAAGLAAVSLTALVLTIRSAANQASASGFFQYLWLAASDTKAALAHWQEYGLSLIESLPIIATILALGALAVLLVAVRRAATASALRTARVSH